ncbi:competence/damage-inducible protein A [Parvularcula sp. LCG005]|uniref:competence/damage-inducible protein A n=1 Tax=Parvularcula sp. LCG005 TaxID=3078805 RepID=UPI0029427372|nr:molybdopterin-binding protein [Parvularcula sp. LCG005]WOI54513.1 molybdopterin-binding protein [Parvularcula sp. LCG005]
MSETQPPQRPGAAMLAIGDELLNGRTRDANIHFLAGWLDRRGVALREVRIVPDEQDMIVAALNELRRRYDAVFTSGGIGPTHDDITADAIGAAFGVDVDVRDDTLSILKEWYDRKGETVTDARRRMARVPEGARLIENVVSGAPGFALENVYVMAGVPKIFSAMLESLDGEIVRGPIYTAYTVAGACQESQIAEGLQALETALKGLKIGSYPGKSGTSGRLAVVCKAFDASLARQAAVAVEGLFRAQGVSPEMFEGFGPEQE